MRSNGSKYHLGKLYYALNLIEGLKDSGVAVQKIISKSQLRYFTLDDPEKMVPVFVLYDFFEKVQEDQGIENMAKTFVDYYRLETMGAYGEFLASSQRILPCILNALKYEKANLSHENNTFEINGNTSYFGNHFSTKPCKGQDFLNSVDQANQLEVIKLSNEEDWSPKEIHVIGTDTSIAELFFPESKAEILTDQDNFGLVFDTATLSNSILSKNHKERLNGDLMAIHKTLAGKIEQLFDTFSTNYLPGIKEVAELFGTSESTLKRNLEKEELSFSILLDRWRFTKAVELLTKSELKINEISDRLFYGNPSNFIRAFNRWSGLNPSSFR